MSLADALRVADPIKGWDWSRCNTRMGAFGWDYVELLREHVVDGFPTLDIGTGGGEVFSSVARPLDVALDVRVDMLDVARERLVCPVVAGNSCAMPFRDSRFGLVASRHVGADPLEVIRVLRPGGMYVTQQPGAHICQSIFDAFGWGSNGEFWHRWFAEADQPFWNADTMASVFGAGGCEIVRRESADVEYEFLDEESLAFWLNSAPLPEKVDPDAHIAILETLDLRTNWNAELLVVRVPS